jgi:hypothetical protein
VVDRLNLLFIVFTAFIQTVFPAVFVWLLIGNIEVGVGIGAGRDFVGPGGILLVGLDRKVWVLFGTVWIAFGRIFNPHEFSSAGFFQLGIDRRGLGSAGWID